jgi:16S rRNA processing protein RimM
MSQDEFFQLGKVVKQSGSNGELVFLFNPEMLPGNIKMESVFIQLQGNLIPFFIDHYRMKSNNQSLVKLLDINSNDDAAPLLGCGLFLPNSMKPKTRKSRKVELDLVGFHVIDHVHGDIGIVVNILEMPMQELLDIDHDGKQILVPLVDEIIIGIDEKKKTLMIEAPEGLIEIYL